MGPSGSTLLKSNILSTLQTDLKYSKRSLLNIATVYGKETHNNFRPLKFHNDLRAARLNYVNTLPGTDKKYTHTPVLISPESNISVN